MSWTETTREQYRRDGLDYASSMKDGEWTLREPFMSAPEPLGRPRQTDLRAVVNAIFYILATGCQWRALPKHFPPQVPRSSPHIPEEDPPLGRHHQTPRSQAS